MRLQKIHPAVKLHNRSYRRLHINPTDFYVRPFFIVAGIRQYGLLI